MLKLAVLCSTVLAVAATAQCNPGTLVGSNVGGNQGNEGGTTYIDLTVNSTITITNFNFRSGNSIANPAASVNQGFLEVWMGPTTWVGNATNAALWTLVGTTVTGNVTHNATGTNPGVLSTGLLTNSITLAPGTYGIALRSLANTWNHNYSNPGAPNPVSTPELTLTAGAATNGFLTGSVFSTRIWNGEVVYTCGGTPIRVASTEPYGNGCYQFNTSYGEIIPNASTSLDIASQTHTLTFAGNSYVVTGSATNTYVAPGPNAVPLPLAAGIDVASVALALGGTLPFPILYPAAHVPGGVGLADDLEVCASGFITPVDVAGAGTTAAAPGAQQGDTSPTTDEFFNIGLERWAPQWQNMTPVNNVFVEVIGTDLVISWAGVTVPATTPGPNTFQCVFSASGNVEYRYDVTNNGVGGGNEPVILGMTQGHGALVNEIDVSVKVLAGFATQIIDNTAISLSMSARPVLGTNPNMVVTGYDAPSTVIGFIVIDITQVNPGNPLAGFGAPGCFSYNNFLAPIVVRTFLTGGAPTVNVPFITGGIPVNNAFNGLSFFAQAAGVTGNCAGNPCNTLGVITSQGLRIFLGTL